MVLERPWASWGVVCTVLEVFGACTGLPRGHRKLLGALLAASWWLTGASRGAPGSFWGSPEGPRRPLGALWALLRPQSGALVAPKSSQERPPRAISRKKKLNTCFIQTYYIFYSVFGRDFLVFYSVFTHCRMFLRIQHFRVEMHFFTAPCAFRAFCFCQGSIYPYFIVFYRLILKD